MFCNMLRIWHMQVPLNPKHACSPTYTNRVAIRFWKSNNLLVTVVNTTREKDGKILNMAKCLGVSLQVGRNCHLPQLQDEPSNALTLHRMDFCVLPASLQLAVPDIAQQFLWSSMECVSATCRNWKKHTCISCCFHSTVSALPSPITHFSTSDRSLNNKKQQHTINM